MKRYFIFILILSVGLFSCQSSDSTASQHDEPTTETNDNEALPTADKEAETAAPISMASFFNDHNMQMDLIDAKTTDCINSHDAPAEKLACLTSSYKTWDKALNKWYKEAMQHHGDDSEQQLKTPQRSWIKYKEAEEKFIEKLYKTYDKSAQSDMNAMMAKTELTVIRTLDLFNVAIVESNPLRDFVDQRNLKNYGADEISDKCMEKYEGSENMVNINTCVGEARDHYVAEMKSSYDKLMSKLSQSEQATLKKIQNYWEQYTKDVGDFYVKGGGSIASTYATNAESKLARERTGDLERYFQLIN